MIYVLGEKRIQTAGDDFYVAPGASVIGNVRFGAGASVWFNCVLRGDSDWIILGDRTNVQDGTVIHDRRVHGSVVVAAKIGRVLEKGSEFSED